MKKRIVLLTAGAVIDAVGGTEAAAQLTARKSQHVSNWRREGRMAAGTFLQFRRHLRYRRYHAPSSLWGIVDPSLAAPPAPPPVKRKRKRKANPAS